MRFCRVKVIQRANLTYFVSPFSSVLPPDARRLPGYVELFLQRVAAAAHGFANAGNGLVFNLSKFNKDVRKLLYNTERNESRRVAAENKPVRKCLTELKPVPKIATPPPSVAQAQPEESDDPEAGDDEFFNFRRSKKDKAEKEEVKDEEGGGEEEGGAGDNNGSDVEEARGSKRDASPGNQPVPKRSLVLQRASVLDHLKSVVEDGMHVDGIIHLLRAYNKALGHRRGMVRACKDLVLFIKEIQDNDGEDDILEMAETYHIALSKLPAILE